MPSHPVTALGLILGMIGVFIIFVWGPPQPVFSEAVGRNISGATRMSDGRTADHHVEDAQANKKFYTRMSGLGLGLVFVGFGLQLVDTFN